MDEYDKPMLQAIGNDELQKSFRDTLKAFYGALKARMAALNLVCLRELQNSKSKCIQRSE